MTTRIVSGIVGIALFVALCFAGLLPFAIAVGVTAGVAVKEFVSGQRAAPVPTDVPQWLTSVAKAYRRRNPEVVAVGALLLPLAYMLADRPTRYVAVFASIIAAGVLGGIMLVARAWTRGGMLGWWRAFYGKIGVWYIGGTLSALILLRGMPGRTHVAGLPEADRGAWIVIVVAVCVWATDTFAYFTGRAIGRHKLAPKLSPAKTIEGFIGGLVGAAAVGTLFAHWIGLGYATGAVIGTIAGVVGPMGDLFESGMKRELGIKDFGSVMPGHGGVLDRFDSLMFVAPLAYLYLLLSGPLAR